MSRQIELIYVGDKLRNVVFHRSTGSRKYRARHVKLINWFTLRHWITLHMTPWYTRDGEFSDILVED